MWDSIISQSKAKRLLPVGVLWVLDRLSFDGVTMQIYLVSKEESKVIKISFEPVYYSISDDWVEDYGGMNGVEGQQRQTSFGSVDDIKKKIAAAFPEQKDKYDSLTVYNISAMQWMMRFACFGTPSVVETYINKEVHNAN